MTTDKLIDKLRKLKNSAEGEAKIGNEAAAQAFAEMLNRLLLENKLEMTDIEFEQMEKDQPVAPHYVNYKAHNIKLKKQRSLWMEQLANVIARAHFCRILVHSGSSRITFLGRKDDCEVVEYMFVTLLRATEQLADEAYDGIVNVVLKECGICLGPKKGHNAINHKFEPNYLRARGFRPAFINGFINRLAERFYDLRRSMEKESTALVRLNRSEAGIKEYLEQKDENGRKKIRNLPALEGRRTGNIEGHRAGRAKAESIPLGANAIKSGNPAVNRQLR